MGDPSEPAKTFPVESNPDEHLTAEKHVGDKYEVPALEPHSSFDSLKQRIRHHYELASDYYYSLWGQHIHHGYWLDPNETKEVAQVNLINLLLEISKLTPNSTVLDVGCGIGGTTRHLAREQGCTVTGITISGRQVQIAKRLTDEDAAKDPPPTVSNPTAEPSLTDPKFTTLGPKGGKVTYLELDAETIISHFPPQSFDIVWISEALSHFPHKPLFFTSASQLLKPGGKLVVADWFKSPALTPTQISSTIKPIEDGMLLPPLCTISDYVSLAESAGLRLFEAQQPKDISQQVAKTWDISWELVSNPSLWAFAIGQGRDGLAFLQAFRAMRRGFAEGSFRYGVVCFEKPQ